MVEDTLNIGAALEAEMAHVIDSYTCEWKAAYSDPAVRARFASFVNSQEADPSVQFETVRGQPQPV